MTLVHPELGRSIDVGGAATPLLDCGQGAPVPLVHGSGLRLTALAIRWRVLPRPAARYRRES
jgi:hypothetical protein